jgi:putative mRNA 3-end processing factor
MPQFGDLLRTTDCGLYCDAGGFYIDPWRPVKRAVITHMHSDHACYGSHHYLGSRAGRELMRLRLSPESGFQFLEYGETLSLGPVRLSLHPAGHMLGSAMVRLEHAGQVALVTGDYKLGHDPTCEPWAPVQCDLLVTETTFGLPVYRWPDSSSVFESINRWWATAAAAKQTCILYGYAVGKSQRLLAGLDPSIGPIYTHGAVENGIEAYRESGVALPATIAVASCEKQHRFTGGIVLAVPSAHATPWTRRFGTITTAMASGWMAIRGTRRRRSVDRGFVISDHVDWPSLLEAVQQCRPTHVWAAHGYTATTARYLSGLGYQSVALPQWVRPQNDAEAEETKPAAG